MITLRFACGHGDQYDETANRRAICVLCGETRVQSIQAPPPKFSGFCTGPSAEMRAIPPHRTRFDGTPVKDEQHG